VASKARQTKKARSPEQQLIRLARRLLPEIQARRGDFRLHDVQNRSEADQRHMLRSEEKKTLQRVTRIDKLRNARVIDAHEAAACQWYADAYCAGYDTVGVTANYGGSGVRSGHLFCHAARYREQREARDNYEFAKQGIPPFLLPLFERVVIEGVSIAGATNRNGRELHKLTAEFRLAANRLHERIAHLLPVG
jgi:hypothetical protein